MQNLIKEIDKIALNNNSFRETLNSIKSIIDFINNEYEEIDFNHIIYLIDNSSNITCLFESLVKTKNIEEKHLIANFCYSSELFENILLYYCEKNNLSIEAVIDEEIKQKKRLLTSEETIMYINKWQKEGDFEARNILIESNDGLVRKVANKYYGLYNKSEKEDILQEGRIGLMKAIDKYDISKGYQFSTYAWTWIRQAITIYIADKTNIIKIPRHLVEKINKINRIKNELVKQLDREPSTEEISKYAMINETKVYELIQLNNNKPVSLDQNIGDDENNSEMMDTIASTENIEDNLLKQISKNELINILYEILNPKELKMVSLRWGLGNNRTHTLNEIGKLYGVTRERVRQIEEKTLKKLKKSIILEKLGDKNETTPHLKIYNSIFNIYTSFKAQDIIESIEELPIEYQNIIYKRYGKDFSQFNNLTEPELELLHKIIFIELEKVLNQRNLVKVQNFMNYFPGEDYESVIKSITEISLSGQFLIYKVFGKNLNETNAIEKTEFAHLIKIINEIKTAIFTKNIKLKIKTIYDLFPEYPEHVILNAIESSNSSRNNLAYRIFGINLDDLQTITYEQYMYFTTTFKTCVEKIINNVNKINEEQINRKKDVPVSLFELINLPKENILKALSECLSEQLINDLYKYYGYDLENPKYIPLTEIFKNHVKKNIINRLRNYIFYQTPNKHNLFKI